MVTPKVQTGLRLDEETLRKITYIAKNQKRSLNAQIEFAVQEAIEKFETSQGKIPPAEQS
jgi:hypothetical protein